MQLSKRGKRLRSVEPYGDAKRVPGSSAELMGRLSFTDATRWRTRVVNAYNDAPVAERARRNGIDVIERVQARLKHAKASDGACRFCQIPHSVPGWITASIVE